MLRPAGAALGVVLLAAGIVTFPLPLPIGAVLMAIGAALLITASPRAARWVRSVRARHPHTDARVRDVEESLPRAVGEVVERTDPARRRADR